MKYVAGGSDWRVARRYWTPKRKAVRYGEVNAGNEEIRSESDLKLNWAGVAAEV
jgi:hypothetical protein